MSNQSEIGAAAEAHCHWSSVVKQPGLWVHPVGIVNAIREGMTSQEIDESFVGMLWSGEDGKEPNCVQWISSG